MTRNIPFLFCLCLVLLPLTSELKAQKITARVQVEGRMREFIVVRPSGAAPAGGFPMVFMLHGTGGDGEKFYDISGWVERGEKDKIVVVFPSSLTWCVVSEETSQPHQTTKWVNGDLLDQFCGKTSELISEELFFRKMVDTITSVLPIDKKRIYLAGFSNGGCMTHKLLVQASDIFAAYGAQAGSYNVLDTGRLRRKVPMMFAVGTLDTKYIDKMGISEIPFNDSCLRYFGNPIKRSLSSLDLTEDYTVYANDKTRSYVFNTPIPGAEPVTFIFTLIKGAQHVYPNGKLHELMMADIHWEFFKTLRLPASLATSVEEEQLQNPFVYPNPASDYITVGELPVHAQTVSVLNALGQIVLQLPNKDATTLDVRSLENGWYTLIAGTQRRCFLVAR